MAEPLRDQALDKLVEKLQALTGTRSWGGAYPSPPLVTRIYRPIETVQEFPHLIVVEASGSRMRLSTTAGGDAGFEDAFRVVVYGYVLGDDVTSRSRWIQRLQLDVIETLLKSQTLGGLIRGLVPEEDLTDEGVLEEIRSGLGLFGQFFTVVIDQTFAVE